MRNLFIYLLIFMLPAAAAAQSATPQILGSGGGDFIKTNLQLSLTIGELSIQTYTAGNRILTEGFQQPFGPGTSLPLTWLSFSGTLVNGQTQLEWITAQEFETDHFDVERSADGSSFGKFAEVKASGNTTGASIYHAIDPSPFAGLTYYRIRQVDIDGKFSYSIIVNVRLDNGTSWQAYPNPVHDRLITAIQLSVPKVLLLDCYDLNGKLLISRQAMCGAGTTLVEWDTRSLAAGIYVIRCRNADLAPIKISKE